MVALRSILVLLPVLALANPQGIVSSDYIPASNTGWDDVHIVDGTIKQTANMACFDKYGMPIIPCKTASTEPTPTVAA